MLTTFVLRIGATTALLSFSTAVAAIAPALSSAGARRGRHFVWWSVRSAATAWIPPVEVQDDRSLLMNQVSIDALNTLFSEEEHPPPGCARLQLSSTHTFQPAGIRDISALVSV